MNEQWQKQSNASFFFPENYRYFPSKALSKPGTAEANDAVRTLLGMRESAMVDPNDFDPAVLYGRPPDDVFHFGKEDGYSEGCYRPKGGTSDTWVVTQHGYAGNPGDWSRLAEILTAEGIGVVTMSMHDAGKGDCGAMTLQSSRDDCKRMSMSVERWAHMARIAARRSWELAKAKRVIFVGHSSGGSSGAATFALRKWHHRISGGLLLAPTLVSTIPPELDGALEAIATRYAGEDGDVLLDRRWLATGLRHMHDERLNAAYQAYCATLPGYPLRAAREAAVVDGRTLIDDLFKTEVPVTLVRGAQDTVDTASMDAIRKELALAPNAHIRIADDVPDAGHHLEIEKPEVVAQLIRELLARMDDA